MTSFDFRFDTVGEPFGGEPGGPYDGPAVVERSTPTELTLAFHEWQSVFDCTASDAPPALALHMSVEGMSDTPRFPVGARVWLTKSAAGEVPPNVDVPISRPRSFAVRDKQGGTLLIAAADDGAPLPLPTTLGSRSCTTTIGPAACAATVTSGSLDFHADSDVVVGDGETATLLLDRVAYDVNLSGFGWVIAGPGQCGAGPVFPSHLGMRFNLRAQDLAARVTQLPAGIVPFCSRGNFDPKWVVFDTLAPLPYEGPASFIGGDAGSFEFALTGGTDLIIQLADLNGQIPVPSVGQTFWLSMPTAEVSVLRSAKDGPVVVAFIDDEGNVPFPSAAIQQALGVNVDLRVSCAYASQGLGLVELEFKTTPPVVVRSADHALVTLAGMAYDVWMDGGSSTVYGTWTRFVVAEH
jgi:hypothetical protein